MTREHLPQIERIQPVGEHALVVFWTGGRRSELDLSTLGGEALLASEAQLDAWGHHLSWLGGEEVGADALWLASLSAWGEEDARAFMEWRLRHGLTASGAAEALGVRRPDVVAWSIGAKPVPRSIMLACRGWESLLQAA